MTTWQVRVERPGFHSIEAPIFSGRGEDRELEWRLHPEGTIAEGFVQIPAGTFIMGGDPNTFESVPRCEPFVEDFAMSVLPVTWSDYIEYLEDLHRSDPASVAEVMPRESKASEAMWEMGEDGRVQFALTPEDAEKRKNWPLFGVPFDLAEAYCEWLSKKQGKTFRLPTDEEWEKAARGVDGRVYPWGDKFDPALCKMAETTEERAQPESVGAYATDVSPYGVRDMAGGVREWCDSWFDEKNVDRLIRGGSWNFRRIGCHCAYRVGANPKAIYLFLGFRLAHSLP